MANRSCNMHRKTVQAMLRHAMPKGRWMSANEILDFLNSSKPNMRGSGVNASWKSFPSTSSSLSGKIKGMEGLIKKRGGPHANYLYMLLDGCEMCDSPATTPERLCDICFDDTMDARHADYTAFMREVSA